MTAGVRTTIATVARAVYRTDGDASENLVYHSLQHGRPRRTKRREQNLIVRSGKSEAAVTTNRRLVRYIVLLKLTTDGHEARPASLRQQSYLSGIGLLITMQCSFIMALCIRRTLSRHVMIGTPTVIFAVLTVF